MPLAFSDYWQQRGVMNQTYKNNILGVPHVCAKVPTAGGKTFIAVNAIEKIFDAFRQYRTERPQFVVWLVPSLTILEQTLKNLSDVEHPYRQRLNERFNGRVHIYEKTDVLQGAGFNADSVRAQLSIVAMSFDSLKSNNKENRKAFQENGYLASFVSNLDNAAEPLDDTDPSALINVIRNLRPLVIVDESHNAESKLSVDMLKNLNPSFIFDLTATPRENSNIISYVDALRLKKQHMVKLPVIVANQASKEDVLNASLKMRYQLEEYAKQEEAEGGAYIRPIVLFQAEPKKGEETTTFEKIKAQLQELKIPAEEIAIKTATINELKGVNLMSRDCPVRYIITINALKEGWDCPFAYILATLANRSSVVDVTQILGRVLRLPHVRRNTRDFLNLSYVFTSSHQFKETLSNVVKGLNKAGFSDRDCREIDISVEAIKTLEERRDNQTPELFPQEEKEDLDGSRLEKDWKDQAERGMENDSSHYPNSEVSQLERFKENALRQSQAYEGNAQGNDNNDCPIELAQHMNTHKMKPIFVDSVQEIRLPQFFVKVNVNGGFFEENQQWQMLSRENLLVDFVLANLDASISFDNVDAEIYAVDAKSIGEGQSSIEFNMLKEEQKNQIKKAIAGQPEAGKIRSIVGRLFDLIGKNAFYPIDDNDVKRYLSRIVESMTDEQRSDCVDKDHVYIRFIKNKITHLANEHGSKNFDTWLKTKRIELRSNFAFLPSISPSANAAEYGNSLYVREGSINGLESEMIGQIAGLDNISWWHRNLERGKGFVLNGFLNHYPDFIVMTKNKNLILVETKGSDRDNSDSAQKIRLGKEWENKANQLSHQTGLSYHYMMVFDKSPLPNAFTISDALKLIKEL